MDHLNYTLPDNISKGFEQGFIAGLEKGTQKIELLVFLMLFSYLADLAVKNLVENDATCEHALNFTYHLRLAAVFLMVLVLLGVPRLSPL